MEAAGDLGFTNATPVQFPYLIGVEPRGDGPAQALAVQPCLGQPSPSAFAQNLAFELREDRKQASHGATSGCGQIQGLGQETKPTPRCSNS